MQDYRQFTDEELIIKLRDGEVPVTDFIMEKYKNLVRKKAESMYILGADREDLIQEGMIGLFKAVRDYDSGRDASFYTFADLCICRQMYAAIQSAGRKKNEPLNTYVSFNQGEEENLEGNFLLQTGNEDMNPERVVLNKENLRLLKESIKKELSGFEKQVFDLFLTGENYVQIAHILGKDEKSTDNALQRIKLKVRKLIYR